MRRAGRALSRFLCLLAACGAAACDAFADRPLGERVWRARCARCHGVDARGNTPRYLGNPYADLTDDLWRGEGDRDSVAEVVRTGIFAEMPAASDLSAEEMSALLDWLYALRGETP